MRVEGVVEGGCELGGGLEASFGIFFEGFVEGVDEVFGEVWSYGLDSFSVEEV